ncbi:MAG: 23S rRNA pseudouridine(1911/1915/1917) synthase RluD [Legionella sp.]|nr:MAG: 23S rRNA pseudouridine(1911/1915/1917) synthase RluD [Legionella sp.]
MTAHPITVIVSPDYTGQRIDRVLAQLFPEWSRSKLCMWLKEGLVTVNQNVYKPNDKVWGGEEIILTIRQDTTPSHHQPENLPLDILFEDDDVLVINKAPGLIVHPGAGNPNGTLLNALLHHHEPIQNVPRAGIVHRLDKDTSGIMVVAKTLEAHTNLVRQMQAREIQRQYLALVYGHVIAGKTISTGYGRDPHNRLKMAVMDQGKPAITHFTVRKQYQFVSLLNVALHTGRTHQIRVHMAHIKHPIVGDPLYHNRNSLKAGMSADLRQTLTTFPRQALHAHTLSFKHPILDTALTFEAPIPYDFQTLLAFLDQDITL